MTTVSNQMSSNIENQSVLTASPQNAASYYQSLYRKPPLSISFCPYRICPMGAHSDHNLGRITGFAIDKGVNIAYGPKKNGVIEMSSLQFDKRAQWHVSQVESKPVGDWADYLRGATWALGKFYQEKTGNNLHVGLSGCVEGTMPIGGLSSSAAVIIAFLSALAEVNNITLTEEEMIQIALEAERDYVGVTVGTLDQSCEVYARKGQLLYLDTKDNTYELIPTPANMKPYAFMIFFSGIERNLAGSKFNMRVDEAKSAAYALMAYEGMEYGKYNEAVLRDVPREVFEKHKDKLPENWRKRAEHWYTEYDRVVKGAEAWRKGDIEEYGRLSFESGWSSIHNWETGSPELIKLYELMRECKGVYGGRFSGAGFKGCCMAIVDPEYIEEISRRVEEEYLKAFPELKGKFSVHVCYSADGVGARKTT